MMALTFKERYVDRARYHSNTTTYYLNRAFWGLQQLLPTVDGQKNSLTIRRVRDVDSSISASDTCKEEDRF